MMTVTIFVNDVPIYTRSVVNISKDNEQPQKYQVDTGKIIFHKQEDGAIVLAHKLLDTITEVGK